MSDAAHSSLRTLVEGVDRDDPKAVASLFGELYGELHRLAESHLRRQGHHVTLGATTLLHEAYVSICSRDTVAFPDRNRFFAYASRAMRGLVIDYVRERGALKRGGDLTFTTLHDDLAERATREADTLRRLGHALDELALVDASLAELVDLKFFCGFTVSEIAAMRGVSERTAQRDWAKARVLLHELLEPDERA